MVVSGGPSAPYSAGPEVRVTLSGNSCWSLAAGLTSRNPEGRAASERSRPPSPARGTHPPGGALPVPRGPLPGRQLVCNGGEAVGSNPSGDRPLTRLDQRAAVDVQLLWLPFALADHIQPERVAKGPSRSGRRGRLPGTHVDLEEQRVAIGLHGVCSQTGVVQHLGVGWRGRHSRLR